MDDEALSELRAKYVELRAMRSDRVREDHDVEGRMRALAERFPGALREIDELSIDRIDARIAALDAALEGREPVPRWAVYLAEYHAWMRAALAMRRAAGRDRDRARALAWIEAHEGDPPGPEILEEIDALLRPPQGRLSRWVLARIASRAGLALEEVEAEAFPPSPRRGRRARIA
jgi:hypothetical protein